jgi:hypothetical protein
MWSEWVSERAKKWVKNGWNENTLHIARIWGKTEQWGGKKMIRRRKLSCSFYVDFILIASDGSMWWRKKGKIFLT